MKIAIAFLMVSMSWMSAFAQPALDTAQHERAKALYSELRCVVCQNQSIGESDADVAKDLRQIVSEQIAAGQTNSQVKQYLVDRYGEFILLKPVLAWHTLILWLAPALLLVVGIGFAWSRRGKAEPEAVASLTPDEERRIAELIDKKS
ncbi:cytochrome c-type biogenesis protein [Ahrensia sp. R2A130]|uniref:cytochrome c-type biogenesis protein n=1 Tax=Ahrensia sp. R2A130 TaxID=744979 RepID=UPI0001E0E8D3|nr:cytochrome c-type biogenesis protein [Ahrensia sp. R2A130]EFL88977.1 cytoChrome c-type biogenesis protein CcmH [Ahrensia sp. R2A130]